MGRERTISALKILFIWVCAFLISSSAFAKFSTDELTGTTSVSTPTLTLTGTGTINGLDAIDATGESTLEATLELQSLQGAVTDAQVPDTITASNYLPLSGGTITGNLGINTAGPDRRLDVLDATNPQMRLTHTDGSVYADFQATDTGIKMLYGSNLWLHNAGIDTNLFVGSESGKSVAAGGVQNTAFGPTAGDSLTTGDDNNFIGYAAGQSVTTASGNNFMGRAAGYSTTGGSNTFIGSTAGYGVTTGTENTLVGFAAGGINTTFTGANNVGVGSSVFGNSGVTGDYNVAMGYQSGWSLTSGTGNILIGGRRAGSESLTLSTGSYNVVLGSHSDITSSGTSSSIGIGYGVDITASNQLVIGSNDANGSITDAYLGQGVTKASPAGITVNATGGSGTDNAGASLTIAGGKGTGNAAGGDIIFQTSDAGASGTTLQSLSTKMILDELGGLSLGTAGVKLSNDGDGAITLLGLGNGNDEDLTLNLDDTANTAFWTSSTGLNKWAIANGSGDTELHLYSDFTDASNYSRLELATQTSNSVIGILTRGAGTVSGQALEIGTLGVTDLYFTTQSVIRWYVRSNGHLVSNADNTYDIGESGAKRPRNIYVGTDVFVATEAYDATGWNGDLSVPTKDAVRDKIESLSAGGDGMPNGGYFVGTRYYYGWPYFTNNNTGNALVADRLYARPFMVGKTTTFERIGCNIITAAASSSIRLGIYNFENGLPTTLVLDAGTIDSSTTGVKEITISQQLTPGAYAFAWVSNGTPTPISTGAPGTGDIEYFWGAPDTSTGATIRQAYYAFTYAALPANYSSSVTYDTSNNPAAVFLRDAS